MRDDRKRLFLGTQYILGASLGLGIYFAATGRYVAGGILLAVGACAGIRLRTVRRRQDARIEALDRAETWRYVRWK